MKKFAALFLSIILILSIVPVYAATGEWTGTGTQVDPYVISDADGLKKLADDVDGGNSYTGTYFKLGADINLEGYNFNIGYKNWDANEKPFSGNFDGDNHKVYNYTYYESNAAALFGLVIGTEDNRASIKNLTVEGALSGEKWVAGIIGYGNYVDVENCVNNATVSCENKWEYKGGIAAYMDNSTITHCINNGQLNVAGSKQHNGGIVGVAYGTTIADCVNNADIIINTPYNNCDTYSGGIAGTSWGNVTITRCVNNGDLVAPSPNGNYRFVGGIVGMVENKITITECYNTGELAAGSSWDNGGIVGKVWAKSSGNWCVVKDCFSIGNGSSAGIAGYVSNYATFENCYTTTSGWSLNPVFSGIDNSNVNIINVYTTAVIDEAVNNYHGGKAVTEDDLTNGALVTNLNADRVGDEAPWAQGASYPELKVFMTEEEPPVVITAAEISAVNGAVVTYAVTLADADSAAKVMVALYNGNDLVSVKSAVADETTVTLATAEGATKAKIFVWENLTTARPIVMDEYSIQ